MAEKIKISEKQLVSQVIDYLNLKGHFVWRNNTGAFMDKNNHFYRFGANGSPDVIGCLKGGQFIGVECKVGRNKVSECQKDFIQKINDVGGLAVIIYSIDELIEFEKCVG